MEPRDPRAVLGVDASATAEEIHEAYARTAKRIHPDNFDRRRQPDLWRAANAALVELNEAYALLCGATRRASQREPSQPDFSISDIAEGYFRRWRPNWGMPDLDYEAFFRRMDMARLVADVAAAMRTRVGLTQRDVLYECQAILVRREGELRKAMALWYCDRAMETRDSAIQEFNAVVRSLPRADVVNAIDRLVQSLEVAAKCLELAAALDPQTARLREVQARLATDLGEARSARKRAESVPSGARPFSGPGNVTAAPSHPVQRPRRRRWVWLALTAVAVLLILWAVVPRKRSKEDMLRREFSALLEAGRNGNQTRSEQLLSRLVARTDTGYIDAAINVGSGTEPGLRQTALLYLARTAAQASVSQRCLVVVFALQSLASGEEYAKSYARYCLDQFDPAWLQSGLQNVVLGAKLNSVFRTAAAQELLQRGGVDAVEFLLGRNAEVDPAVDIVAVLSDADPYDIVAGSRQVDAARIPPRLRARIERAERTLEASRGVSFAQARVDGLDAETAQIEIHNEARVDLYLDLTPRGPGSGYSFMFPAQTTRKVAIRARSYYYRADARRSDIIGTRGAHEFAGSYSHTWVFFLEDQRAQMTAKYPDMQFR